jgi:hypothetical protein
LQPLAGSFASTSFGSASARRCWRRLLPLSTAYSVSEALGREARVEASIREEPVFYGTYALVVGVGALVVLVPGAPLVPILFLTEAINAVLLLRCSCSSPYSPATGRRWASTQPVRLGRW